MKKSISIKYEINKNGIENAIALLMDSAFDVRVTRAMVLKKIKEILYEKGREGLYGDGFFDDDNWAVEDVAAIVKKAVSKATQLFPEYY